MTKARDARRWLGPPLALQIMGLLLAGLVVAQGATLALTLLLPPEPRSQWNLGDIAHVLAGRPPDDRNARLLQRSLQAGPPETKGPGWLLSETVRRELARLLERPEEDVRLYFYTPLPFAGTGVAAATARPVARATLDGPLMQAGTEIVGLPEPFFLRVQAGGGPGGGGMGGMGGGGLGGNRLGVPGFPDSGFQRQTAPDGTTSSRRSGTGSAGTANSATEPSTAAAAAAARQTPAAADGNPGATAQTPSVPTAPTTPAAPTTAGRDASPTGAQPGNGAPSPALSPQPQSQPQSPARSGAPEASQRAAPSGGRQSLDAPVVRPRTPDAAEPAVAPPKRAASVPQRKAAAALAQPTAPAPAPAVAPAAPLSTGRPPVAAVPMAPAAPPVEPVEVRPATRGLFGLAPAPFVEGDFVAAVHTVEGSWVVVRPIPEPFPNAWQRRVLLWFAIAAAVVLPAGWLFSRRLVRPIGSFARAAERLGRDPSAPVLALEGPAEIGRAAEAFNRMQSRLRSFVEDRTVMIGAISHDLRTPLTRMRFRIEDVPDDVRAGMLDDVEEMEQMIGAVLAFIRDASTPGTREQMNLASLVDDVVEQAVFVGKNVRLAHSENAPVEVDAIGMRRILDNLIENAVKYGTQAAVRLFRDGDDAVVEISDRGPGIAQDELERVFQPFYRTAGARAAGVAGSGLGLAVCRSIARAHGGDVVLKDGARGLVAQLRVPLATQASLQRAA